MSIAMQPNLDLTVSSGAKTLALHTDNYYKLQFTALDFQPSWRPQALHAIWKTGRQRLNTSNPLTNRCPASDRHRTS